MRLPLVGERAYTVVVRFHVWGRTQAEAEDKVTKPFNHRMWPRGSVTILKTEEGMTRRKVV